MRSFLMMKQCSVKLWSMKEGSSFAFALLTSSFANNNCAKMQCIAKVYLCKFHAISVFEFPQPTKRSPVACSDTQTAPQRFFPRLLKNESNCRVWCSFCIANKICERKGLLLHDEFVRPSTISLAAAVASTVVASSHIKCSSSLNRVAFAMRFLSYIPKYFALPRILGS